MKEKYIWAAGFVDVGKAKAQNKLRWAKDVKNKKSFFIQIENRRETELTVQQRWQKINKEEITGRNIQFLFRLSLMQNKSIHFAK